MTADPHAFNAEPPQPAAVPPNAAAGTRPPSHPTDAGHRGVPAHSLLSARAERMERERLAEKERASRAEDAKLFAELGRDGNLEAMRDASLGKDPPLYSCSDADVRVAVICALVALATGVLIIISGVTAWAGWRP